MARFRLRALRRALRSHVDGSTHVHFHNGPSGEPAACFDSGCTSPKLEVG